MIYDFGYLLGDFAIYFYFYSEIDTELHKKKTFLQMEFLSCGEIHGWAILQTEIIAKLVGGAICAGMGWGGIQSNAVVHIFLTLI